MGSFRRLLVGLIAVASLPLAFGLAGSGGGQQEQAASQTTAKNESKASDPVYQLEPGDMLTINVWREPDLSGNVVVRPDGKISLPLLNDVQASGKTPTELASLIEKDLGSYVSHPRVTVIVTQALSQRIYVLGDVAKAGVYPVFPDMTVLQGISSAGGLAPLAKGKHSYILRDQDGKKEKIPFNCKEVLKGNDKVSYLPLKAGDTIVVR